MGSSGGSCVSTIMVPGVVTQAHTSRNTEEVDARNEANFEINHKSMYNATK